MTWDTHFNKSLFGNCSGGGLWLEPHPDDHNIVLAQYGKQDGASCIFKVDMETRRITLLAQLPDNADAHGIAFCKTTGGDMTVLNTNRQTATLDVVNYTDGTFLLSGYDMNEEAFDAVQAAFHSEPKETEDDDDHSGHDHDKHPHRRLADSKVQKLQPDVAFL